MSSFTRPQVLIPGAYERNTLIYRQPGSMGGSASGSAYVPNSSSSMDAATIADREMEGGGGVSQRCRSRVDLPQNAGARPANAPRDSFGK